MNPNDKNQSQLSWSNPHNGGAKKPEAPQPKAPASQQTPSSSIRAGASSRSAARIVGWLAVGVVAGVILAWGATKTIRTSSTTAGSLENASSTSNSPAASSALLTVASQKAGMSVEVSDVTVSAPTWVVVYESRGGKPGNVLGASLFFSGTSAGTVELLRATIAGQTYFVTERKDNGDHQFSLVNDPLVLGPDGQPSWATFAAN